jgi:hypothetical protein
MGFDSQQRKAFFFSPPHPDRLWDPPTFKTEVYQGFIIHGQNGRNVKF